MDRDDSHGLTKEPFEDAAPRRAASLALLVALAASGTAFGQAGLLVPTESGVPDASILSLREMSIDVGIARGYARVNVRQVFENHTDAIQEGTYRFQLPPSAAVGDFAVWDGLVRIPGVILEKQRARAIYRELTTQRIDPGLLQQGEEESFEEGEGEEGAERPSGGALFSVTIAPIPPRATKRLELAFQQEVPVVGMVGELRLRLKPSDGEPPVAGKLHVRVSLEDADLAPGDEEEVLALRAEPGAGSGAPVGTAGGGGSGARGATYVFEGENAALDRDLVVRLAPRDRSALKLSAYRNPEGALPDAVRLAPWERPTELPPEKDGFFLLELLAPEAGPAEAEAAQAAAPPLAMAILFDTSLSMRFASLEASYGDLVEVLGILRPIDRFVLVPFDASPAPDPAGPRPATPDNVKAALEYLRQRPLQPGTDVVAALGAARAACAGSCRALLLTDGQGMAAARAIEEAAAGMELHVRLSGDTVPASLGAAAKQVLGSGAAGLEAELFLRRLVGPVVAAADAPEDPPVPFAVKGGDPGLRDVYPVLVQPIEPGSLSGWVGRYRTPQPALTWELSSHRLDKPETLQAGLPERGLEARDLPRRWARARVDDLLERIEREGERREWVEEIIQLSSRFRFVTPYTAFLAAPRSLLRPRRIQPGDPVLRVECDAATTSVVAHFPFGLRLPLVRRPGTTLWEGRFLVPEGLADGRYALRIVLRDASGHQVTESKHFVLDGTAPTVTPLPMAAARAGSRVRVDARADQDVIVLAARIAGGPPVPLRWDAAARCSRGVLAVPEGAVGPVDVTFEAVDGANNHGFARARLEVLP